MSRPELRNRYQLFIGGQWRDASDGEFFTTRCPVNGEKLAECARAAKENVDDAVREAWKAFEAWRKIPTSERATILSKIADIIDADTEHLAMAGSLDSDKPIHEIMTIDILLSVKCFRYFAGCIMTEEGSTNILDKQLLSLILCELIGAVEQIVPWNLPFLMVVWKLAPALTAGCCSVFKSSSNTSLSVLEPARLVQDVIPKGVFNVMTGSGSRSGQCILDCKGFRKLVFTGSTEAGRQVAPATAGRLIPATLELGGKSANVFFPDCNWGQAIDGLQLGTLFNQGQVRCTGSRIFMCKDVYDKSPEDAVRASDSVKVDASWDPEIQMGSQINERQLEKILSYVKIGRREDTRLIYGGERLTEGGLVEGCFMRPTLLTDATNDMRITQEGIFGPVACILKFKDKDKAIRMVNDNTYGLGDVVQTRDLNRAIRVSRGIEAGRMWVSAYNQVPEGPSFGGCKEPGADHETRKVILEYYIQMKNIMINPSEAPSGFYPAR